MAQDLQHEHPPVLLHLQVRPRASQIRRHHHQLRLRQRLHRPPGPPRLHLNQGCHRLFHPRPLQPAGRTGHPRQRRRPGTCVDPLDPVHDEGVRHRTVQRDADGEAGPAERDRNMLRVLGESGQQFDFRADVTSEWWDGR